MARSRRQGERFRGVSPITRWGRWVSRQGEDSPNPGGDIWLGTNIQVRRVKSKRLLRKYPTGIQFVADNKNRSRMWRVSKDEESAMRKIGYTRIRKDEWKGTKWEKPDWDSIQKGFEKMWKGGVD